MNRIFGSISLQEMTGNRDLTRTVMERVARACEFSDGRFDLDAVVNGLGAGQLSIWGVLKPPKDLAAVAISRVTTWESGVKVFELLLIGGPEFTDMMPFLDRFEAPARKEGCIKIRLYGRTSWGNLSQNRGGKSHRLLPKDWRVAAVVYEKDLAPDVAR